GLDWERVMVQLAMMRRLIALRAVTWRAWAVVGAAAGTRASVSDETLTCIRMYLAPAFLRSLFASG
ncbi:MAG: hypothetical protein M3439_02230, partial [Chloroflexota bacterium]|nr:hypothetical protein [Chloroflexota bacterium]